VTACSAIQYEKGKGGDATRTTGHSRPNDTVKTLDCRLSDTAVANVDARLWELDCWANAELLKLMVALTPEQGPNDFQEHWVQLVVDPILELPGAQRILAKPGCNW